MRSLSTYELLSLVGRDDDCWKYANKVWRALKGENLGDQPSEGGDPSRFQRLQKCPNYTSLVLMLGPVTSSPHVGVLYKNRVFHLRPRGTVEATRPDRLVGYREIAYYQVL